MFVLHVSIVDSNAQLAHIILIAVGINYATAWTTEHCECCVEHCARVVIILNANTLYNCLLYVITCCGCQLCKLVLHYDMLLRCSSYSMLRLMCWFGCRGRVQRNVVCIVNCTTPWINRILNAHCVFGLYTKERIVHCKLMLPDQSEHNSSWHAVNVLHDLESIIFVMHNVMLDTFNVCAHHMEYNTWFRYVM